MKVQCSGTGYHPATGLDLVAGEMEVTEDQAATLEAAGLLVTKAKRAPRPEKDKEE
jgi:hypothetical protein